MSTVVSCFINSKRYVWLSYHLVEGHILGLNTKVKPELQPEVLETEATDACKTRIVVLVV